VAVKLEAVLVMVTAILVITSVTNLEEQSFLKTKSVALKETKNNK